MTGKTIGQTQHADRFSSDPPFSRASFLPVFPFNQTVVTINSVSLTVIFASSVIVADGGTVISIPQATNLMNAPIFSITPTIIDRTSPIIFSKRVLAIDGPYTIMSGPDSIIHTQEAVISAVETIISATEMDFLKADAINPVVDTTIPAVHTIISAIGVAKPAENAAELNEKLSVIPLRVSGEPNRSCILTLS